MKKVCNLLLILFIIMNSIFYVNVFAEGDEQEENPSVIQENDNDNQLRGTPDPDGNDYEYADAGVNSEYVHPESYCFYIETVNENNETVIENHNNDVYITYSYFEENTCGYDLNIKRSVLDNITQNDLDAFIKIVFSDNNEPVTFDIFDCIYGENDGNNYYPSDVDYEIEIWAVYPKTVHDISIVYKDENIELSCMDEFDYRRWYIDGFDGLAGEFNNALFGDQTANFNYSIEYFIGDSEIATTVSMDDVQYGNYEGRHGYYYEYNVDGEKGLILIGETEYAVTFAEISNAYFIDNDKNINVEFIVSNGSPDDHTTVYLLNLDENFDLANLSEGDYLKIIPAGDNAKPEWFFIYNRGIYGFGNARVLGAEIYYTKVNDQNVSDPNYRMVFIAKVLDEGPDGPDENNSLVNLIDPDNNYDFDLFFNNSGDYNWEFYINPVALYIDSEFSFTATFEFDKDNCTITENENVSVNNNGTVTVDFLRNNEVSFEISKQDGNETVKQTHYFVVRSRLKSILDHTFVSSLNEAQGINLRNLWFHEVGNFVGNYNFNDGSNNSGLFKTITVYLEIEGSPEDLISKIEKYNNGETVEENFENKYFSIAFLNNVNKQKEYFIFEEDGNVIPAVKYTLTKDNQTEEFLVKIRFYNSGPSDSITIDGDRYNKFVINKYGHDYTVYIKERTNTSPDTILEYVDYDYDVLIAKVGYEHDNNVELYDDGTFYRSPYTIRLEIYYPINNYEIKNNISLNNENIRQIDELKDFIILKDQNGEGVTYSEISNTFAYNKRCPSAYYDADGAFHIINRCFFNYDDFLSYEGDEPAYYYGIVQLQNGKFITSKQIKTKRLISVVDFEKDGAKNTSKGQLNAPVILEVSAGQSAVAEFKKAIAKVYGYDSSRIKLNSNITLDGDLIIDMFWLMDQGISKTNIIDLNGHNIYTNGFKIEIPDECGIIFENSSSETASIENNVAYGPSISDSEKTAIKSYGYTEFSTNNGSIYIINDYGAAITVLNDGDSLEIDSGVDIYAKTGIKWIERKSGIFFPKTSVNITLAGNIIASDYCIYADLPTKNSNIIHKINLWKPFPPDIDNEEVQKLNIPSELKQPTNNTNGQGVGVYANGEIVLSAGNYRINTKKPFVINGGKFNFNDVYITATEGDIFYVDSMHENASPTKIFINLEGPLRNRLFSSTNGSIVYDNNAENFVNSVITKISMVSAYDANVFFDYQNLFTNIPSESGAVEINGGYYSDNSFAPYLSNNYSTETLEKDDKNNPFDKTFYRIIKPTSFVRVSDFEQLKEALTNENKPIIYVTDDIIATGTLDERTIEFNVGSSKIINMNGNSFRNIRLQANSEADEYNGNNGEFKVFDGTIRNNEDTLIINGAILRLVDSSVISKNGNAIVLNNGAIDVDRDCIVKGKTAVKVDITIQEDADEDDYYGRLNSYYGTFVGVGGPAILVESTYEKGNNNYPNLNFNNSVIKVVTDESERETADVNAIHVNDNANVSLNESELTSGATGIYYYADESGENGPKGNIYLYNANVTACDGIHLSPKTIIYIRSDVIISADNNGIEAYNSSRIEMTGGYISAGNEIIQYYGNGNNHQQIRGGSFSKVLTARSVSNDNFGEYTYVCLQIDPLDSTYPYAVVKKYKQTRIYQNISDSIERDASADPDQLLGAVSDSERNALEEAGDIDIIFTLKPETNPDNISTFTGGGFIEFFDAHVNKNVGEEKARVDEVSDYQVITISINENENPENIIVYHRHGNMAEAAPMKKVSVDNGDVPNEECYYISQGDNNKFFINIVTRRFSTFAIKENSKRVDPEYLKEPVGEELDSLLSGIYKSNYIENETLSLPQTITINNVELTVENNVEIVYEGTDNTVYYSSKFPTQPGSYKVIWTLKEDVDNMSGRGEKEFNVLNETVILNAASLTLDGKVGINFKMLIPDNLVNKAKVKITHNGTTTSLDASTLRVDEKGRRIASIYVHVKQLGVDVTISVADEYNNPIMLILPDGTDYSDGFTYSGRTYINNKKTNGSTNVNLIPMLDALDNFATAAQLYFNYDVVQGETVIDISAISDVTDTILAGYNLLIDESLPGLPAGFKHQAASLDLASGTTIRHKFKITDASIDIDSYTFKVYDPVNQTETAINPEYDQEKDLYILEIENVVAKELDKKYEIRVYLGEQRIYSMAYGALTYAYRKIGSTNANLSNLVKTMYVYNQKAKLYFK